MNTSPSKSAHNGNTSGTGGTGGTGSPLATILAKFSRPMRPSATFSQTERRALMDEMMERVRSQYQGQDLNFLKIDEINRLIGQANDRGSLVMLLAQLEREILNV